jgi:taurine dioxygenase
MGRMVVKPLGFAVGAEVTGIDLKKPIDDLIKHELLAAWHKHLVLIYPGQNLSPQELVSFSKNFGALDENDFQPHYRDPEQKEILLVTNKISNGKLSETRNTGRNWHTDLSYTVHPAKASLLLCKQKPVVGGDTMWANMYLAYETLSSGMRKFVDGLEAIHDASLIKGLAKRDPEKVATLKKLNPPVVHPVVKTHPETGKKALYLGQRVRGFVGFSEEESEPILKFLNEHATSPEFVYRHRWSIDDLVMWDNRCLVHVALPDFDQTQIRHMIRTSVKGEKAGYLFEENVQELDKESLLQMIAAVS